MSIERNISSMFVDGLRRQLTPSRLFEGLFGTGLVDLGRTLDPENPGLFTWWAPWRNLRARNIGWRLDYLLASPTLASRTTTCVVRAEVGTSDHAPVVMTTT